MSAQIPFKAVVMPGGFPVWATLALGFVLGLRHALDADHIAAVATFSSGERNLWRSSVLGVWWGLGHTAALLVFGSAIVALRLTVPPQLGQFLEFTVGCMLIVLGVNVLRRIGKLPKIHVHTHTHDGAQHSHLHVHLGDENHGHQHHVMRVSGQPFVVGVVHGLAGTAAVLLLVLGAIPSLLLGLGVILIFSAGTISGMMVMSVLVSVPLALAARHVCMVERVMRLAAGAFSLGFGLLLAWHVGFLQGLLS